VRGMVGGRREGCRAARSAHTLHELLVGVPLSFVAMDAQTRTPSVHRDRRLEVPAGREHSILVSACSPSYAGTVQYHSLSRVRGFGCAGS
jgi:hypothetical protein